QRVHLHAHRHDPSRAAAVTEMAEAARQVRAMSLRPIRDPGYQAFLLLRFAFSALPIVSGCARILGAQSDTLLMGAGAAEVMLGVAVAFRPALFCYLVAFWLFAGVGN